MGIVFSVTTLPKSLGKVSCLPSSDCFDTAASWELMCSTQEILVLLNTALELEISSHNVPCM